MPSSHPRLVTPPKMKRAPKSRKESIRKEEEKAYDEDPFASLASMLDAGRDASRANTASKRRQVKPPPRVADVEDYIGDDDDDGDDDYDSKLPPRIIVTTTPVKKNRNFEPHPHDIETSPRKRASRRLQGQPVSNRPPPPCDRETHSRMAVGSSAAAKRKDAGLLDLDYSSQHTRAEAAASTRPKFKRLRKFSPARYDANKEEKDNHHHHHSQSKQNTSPRDLDAKRRRSRLLSRFETVQSDPNPPPSKPKKPASIASFRPAHWNQGKSSIFCGDYLYPMTKLATGKQLAAAISPRNNGSGDREERPAKDATRTNQHQQSSFFRGQSSRDSFFSDRKRPAPRETITASQISKQFKPFIAPPKLCEEQVEDDDDDGHGNFYSLTTPRKRRTPPIPRSHRGSPTRRRRSAKPIGRFSRRLQALRSEATSSLVRLQSGYYATSGRSLFDLNDPRRKAKTITEITLLSNPSPFPKTPEIAEERIITTARLLSHRSTLAANQSSGSASGARHESLDVLSTGTPHELESQVVSIIFSASAAKNLDLVVGVSLRLYNAQIIPRKSPAPLLSGNGFSCLKGTLLCTQLCEHFSRCAVASGTSNR